MWHFRVGAMNYGPPCGVDRGACLIARVCVLEVSRD